MFGNPKLHEESPIWNMRKSAGSTHNDGIFSTFRPNPVDMFTGYGTIWVWDKRNANRE